MFQGYLRYAGVEILNAARTKSYINNFLPRLEVRCDSAGLGEALEHAEYLSPEEDMAPWFNPANPETANFYGLFPGKIQGAEDSTRQVTSTELAGDGAIFSQPRYGSREIRIQALALAQNETALAEGLAWLRDILAQGDVGDALSCSGAEAVMFNAPPSESENPTELLRYMYRVEVIDAPKVVKGFRSRPGIAAVVVEFIMSAGIAWVFTPPIASGSFNMNSALNFTDPVGQDCSEDDDPYADFINDPFFTAISRPPQPPTIAPPNLIALTSWRRGTIPLHVPSTERWGRVVPVITITTTATDVEMLRLRFYRDAEGLTGCGYEGEFLISYLPPAAVLTLDARSEEASVRLANGAVVPASHLLYGTNGAPFTWPTLASHENYTMVMDIMPNQTGTSVALTLAVRE